MKARALMRLKDIPADVLERVIESNGQSVDYIPEAMTQSWTQYIGSYLPEFGPSPIMVEKSLSTTYAQEVLLILEQAVLREDISEIQLWLEKGGNIVVGVQKTGITHLGVEETTSFRG